MNKFLRQFYDQVALQYHLYSSLFMTLPYRDMSEIGALLTLFTEYAAKQLKKNKHPKDIVKVFFKKNNLLHQGREDVRWLFKMLQFVEREIVLFDALEESAFTNTHDMNGPGSLQNLLTEVINQRMQSEFIHVLKDYQIRIVLTAHPTQFYPDAVLSIIVMLSQAIKKKNLKQIRDLLLQMSQTPFKHRKKPTPYEEAASVVWYLERVFYKVIPDLQKRIIDSLDECALELPSAVNGINGINNSGWIQLGFWPGGDRDGNPKVTPEVTVKVAKLLKMTIIKKYIYDLRLLAKKLTFDGILQPLLSIQEKLENMQLRVSLIDTAMVNSYFSVDQLLQDLLSVRKNLIKDHAGLFLEQLDFLIIKVKCFGFYFAMMDIRENALVQRKLFYILIKELLLNVNSLKMTSIKIYQSLSQSEKIKTLGILIKNKIHYQWNKKSKKNMNKQLQQLMLLFESIVLVQHQNGELGLCRYVISNTSSALDMLELLTMFHVSGCFKDSIPVDIIPLFESIADLENAVSVMEVLYQCDFYLQHLTNRNFIQTIMLGFSDGTKDGGYVTANWSIYQAKIKLTELAKKYQIKVIFFDGRGGPPARGGGNTRNFYRSLGSKIEHRRLQLTVQGQTISANFGTFDSAKYNIEQLFTAGLEDLIFKKRNNDLSWSEIALMQDLSTQSKRHYDELKNDDLFVTYLEEMTPLQYYGELNISSRPVSRSKTAHLKFADLRAIPFVGAWSQLRQNIPGYYGFGSALQALIQQGKQTELQALYQHSYLFKTLVENAMMSLSKTFFPLTAYMKQDVKYGQYWTKLFKEAELTTDLLKQISGQNVLLENDSLNRESIIIRENITLPLLIIQQYALTEIKQLAAHDADLVKALKEIILKALATNTNASRNSA